MTSFLPTSSPSTISGRLGHPWFHKNWARTWVKPTPGSFQINLLFTIFAEQAQETQNAPCKLLFLQKTTQTEWSQTRHSIGAPIQAVGHRWPARPERSGKAATASGNKNGGAERDRTADPLLAKQVLSQLSYSPDLSG